MQLLLSVWLSLMFKWVQAVNMPSPRWGRWLEEPDEGISKTVVYTSAGD